jgi:hypothetical protein
VKFMWEREFSRAHNDVRFQLSKCIESFWEEVVPEKSYNFHSEQSLNGLCPPRMNPCISMAP